MVRLSTSLFVNILYGFLATAFVVPNHQSPLKHAPTCLTVQDYGYKGPGAYKILSLESPSNVAIGLADTTLGSEVVAQ